MCMFWAFNLCMFFVLDKCSVWHEGVCVQGVRERGVVGTPISGHAVSEDAQM